MMKHKIGIISMGLGIICLSVSVGLLCHNQIENKRAGTAAQSILCDLQSALPSEQLSLRTLPEQTERLEEDPPEMTVTEINGYGYIGCLTIPSIDIELPVMDDWDYTRLKLAPCRQFGSLQTNDLVIAAHNYQRHFGKLNQLEYGDIITFTDMDGVMTFYQVSDIETLQPTQVEEVKKSIWDLTLYRT